MLANLDICGGSACDEKRVPDETFAGQGTEYSVPDNPQHLPSRQQELGDTSPPCSPHRCPFRALEGLYLLSHLLMGVSGPWMSTRVTQAWCPCPRCRGPRGFPSRCGAAGDIPCTQSNGNYLLGITGVQPGVWSSLKRSGVTPSGPRKVTMQAFASRFRITTQ